MSVKQAAETILNELAAQRRDLKCNPGWTTAARDLGLLLDRHARRVEIKASQARAAATKGEPSDED